MMRFRNKKTMFAFSLKEIWLCFYIYSCVSAILFQWLILPLFPTMHAGNGLLINDASMFHNMAVEISLRINQHGWGEWSLIPKGAAGNVGLLSAVYALIYPNPLYFVPINAAAHATGAYAIYLIGVKCRPTEAGVIGSFIGAICFLIFPASLQWYGQNHKDAFSIAGTLLILNYWISLCNNDFKFSIRSVLVNSFVLIISVGIVGIVRPHYVLILGVAFSVSLLIIQIRYPNLKQLSIRIFFVALLICVGLMFSKIDTAANSYALDLNSSSEAGYRAKEFQWRDLGYLPEVVDKSFRRASELRAHFIEHGQLQNATSDLDVDRRPASTLEALMYLPRALVVGLFAPFPDTWFTKITFQRSVGVIETFVWYLVFGGLLFTSIRLNNPMMFAAMVYAIILICMMSFIHPNIGTLHRQRYGLLHLLMMLGCIGWVECYFKVVLKLKESGK